MAHLLTPAEARPMWRASHVARLLGLQDPRTVNEWAKAGKIPAVELPTAADGRRQFRYVAEEVEAWIESRKNKAKR